MTSSEFETWQNRLFIMQPSLLGWLKQNSPDYRETLKLWFQTLRPYRLDECLLVLQQWATGVYEPPKAYERDNFALHVRSSVELKRDRQRKRDEQQNRMQDYQRHGGVRKAVNGLLKSDPGMLRAYNELKSENEKLRKGLIDEAQYDARKQAILEQIK